MLAGASPAGTPTSSRGDLHLGHVAVGVRRASGVPNSAAATMPDSTSVPCTHSSSAGSPAA